MVQTLCLPRKVVMPFCAMHAVLSKSVLPSCYLNFKDFVCHQKLSINLMVFQADHRHQYCTQNFLAFPACKKKSKMIVCVAVKQQMEENMFFENVTSYFFCNLSTRRRAGPSGLPIQSLISLASCSTVYCGALTTMPTSFVE